jgi:hypothetical protein
MKSNRFILKSRSTWKAVLVPLALIGGANAALVSINFEDGTGHDNVIPTTHYAGVTILNAVWIAASGFHNGSFGMGVDAGTQSPNNWAFPGTSSPISIIFPDSALASSFSINAFGVGNNGAIIEAFDSSNNLLNSNSFTGSGDGVGTNISLTVSATNIKTVKLRQVNAVSTDGLGWDNASAQTVPEPSSVIMLGLASLGFSLRRQRR